MSYHKKHKQELHWKAHVVCLRPWPRECCSKVAARLQLANFKHQEQRNNRLPEMWVGHYRSSTCQKLPTAFGLWSMPALASFPAAPLKTKNNESQACQACPATSSRRDVFMSCTPVIRHDTGFSCCQEGFLQFTKHISLHEQLPAR